MSKGCFISGCTANLHFNRSAGVYILKDFKHTEKKMAENHIRNKSENGDKEEDEILFSKDSCSTIESMETSQPFNRNVEVHDSPEETCGDCCKCRKRKKSCKSYVWDIDTKENKPANECAESLISKEKFIKDNFDAFGKSVSAQLKFLPLQKAIATQETIQAILRDELLKAFKHAG